MNVIFKNNDFDEKKTQFLVNWWRQCILADTAGAASTPRGQCPKDGNNDIQNFEVHADTVEAHIDYTLHQREIRYHWFPVSTLHILAFRIPVSQHKTPEDRGNGRVITPHGRDMCGCASICLLKLDFSFHQNDHVKSHWLRRCIWAAWHMEEVSGIQERELRTGQ